ncbi:hypothetical protein GCM10011391_03180 [Pullulanibacillus camelliae]|uniref:Uncharacterized protein n=1 Tax=Pullulanibacillus camelliae TaxID=1707096 RepID=A0A8J2VKE3_9BACL|nr:hypothetical protein [Pullulanibacillus camelliae]GGE28043.1 hypothetical protein GCM10011391_03180 [Pullulanibacillus camelliae]
MLNERSSYQNISDNWERNGTDSLRTSHNKRPNILVLMVDEERYPLFMKVRKLKNGERKT